jgi:hypothetical protein
MPPMCKLHSHTKGPKAIRATANAMGGDWLENAGNLEPQPELFPDGVAPVVRATPGGGARTSKSAMGFPIAAPGEVEKYDERQEYDQQLLEPLA